MSNDQNPTTPLGSRHLDWIITFRPMSYLLKGYVVPEVEARLANGAIRGRPVSIHQFLFLQAKGRTQVQINDEVQLLLSSPSLKLGSGQPVYLNDVDQSDCFLEPFTLEGETAAYFFCLPVFLNFFTFFDFTPNAPGDKGEPRKMHFPLKEFLNARQTTAAMQPVQRFKQLADAYWPPGPAYYPNVLWHVHATPNTLSDPGLVEVVAQSYSHDYWNTRAAFWTETAFFGERTTYVTKSIREYLEDDFVAAIFILVPQFEGIVRWYLESVGTTPNYRFESCLKQLRTLLLSRPVMMFPEAVLDLTLNFLQESSFLAETNKVSDPSREVSRHGIAHGRFARFESREIALKYLILMDGLGHLLLHDKLVLQTL